MQRAVNAAMRTLLLIPATALALSMQTQAPPRVVVDLDVVADTLPLESEVYLSALQSLRPEGPWRDQKNLPEHRWRTFDLARKYHRVLRELRVVRPADAQNHANRSGGAPGRRRPPCRDTKPARGRTPHRRPQAGALGHCAVPDCAVLGVMRYSP